MLDNARGRLPGKPVAIVDIGSNSVRLVSYESQSRAPTPTFNEKVLCGLGRGVAMTDEAPAVSVIMSVWNGLPYVGETIDSIAAQTHTGSLAGSDAAYDAVFERHGVIRAESVEEMLEVEVVRERVADLGIVEGDAEIEVAASQRTGEG